MTTLILDNFLNERYSGYFSRYYRDDVDIFRAPKMEFPNDIKGYDHIILSGSEESILNERDWIEREMEMVHEIMDLKIPTLGICFGHQLIAKALLGPSGVRKADPPEIGWKEVNIKRDNPLFSEVGKEFFVFNSHFDEVCNLGSDFEVLARTLQCDVSAFQVKNSPLWGIQFHPEINVESGKRFIQEIRHLAPELDLDFEMKNARNSGISKGLFENFYAL
jgi:GMP synthase-like glutamine amidotransferase